MTTEKILLEFDPEEENILPALKKLSANFHYVSKKDARKTAEYFKVPLSKIYETGSFYDLVKTKKEPAVTIQVCSSVNCAVKNSFSIVKEIENYLHIKEGDEFNPRVKLEIISCLGRCREGPIMVVNGEIYERVGASKVHGILEKYL